MKKTIRRILASCIIFTICLSMNSNPINAFANESLSSQIITETKYISEADWKKCDIGEYPISVDSPEWKTMSYCAAEAACNMPIKYAQSLSTKELVEYAVNHPFLIDIFLFNSIEEGMKHLEESFTVFKELFGREDCAEQLLHKYIALDSSVYTAENLVQENYDTKIFIETYFGLNYSDLEENITDQFVSEFEKKYLELPETIQNYTLSMIFFEGINENMGYVPVDAIPDTMKDNWIQKDIRNELSFTKLEPVTTIMNGAYYYYGYQVINGVSVYCYQFFLGDFSTEDKKYIRDDMADAHPTFSRVSDATKKYNCHSYAWYSVSTSNILWINDPGPVYGNTNYYAKWIIPMNTPVSGDKVLFFTGSNLQHSAVLTGTSTCISKLGQAGVYRTTVNEMKSLYNAPTTQFYIPK